MSRRNLPGWLALAVALWVGNGSARPALGQVLESDIARPAPPALDEFEKDANQDGVPDGWYNFRDGVLQTEGGASGPRFVRFESTKPGRLARISRAFGVDGSKYEAIVIGLWVRVEKIETGERPYEEPSLMIDFLGPKLRQLTRGTMGTWTARKFAGHPGWNRVTKRIAIPPETLDAIMTVGLLGATGVLDIDGFSTELIPREPRETTNLIKNPGFELGDPDPTGWSTENGARRSFPGFKSSSALELARAGARVTIPLALPVEPFPELEVRIMAKGKSLRGALGSFAAIYFLGDNGAELNLPPGKPAELNWSDTFDWQVSRARIPVPRGAVVAVLQIKKSNGIGTLHIDDVSVTVSPGPNAGTWTPYQIDNDSSSWLPVKPSTQIEPDSALDFSFLVEGPAGKNGRIKLIGNKEKRFGFSSGTRVKFLGVQLLPPMAFLDAARADTLADRLSRSGINLVRLGDLDTPLGPDRSLLDDSRDDTLAFDEIALGRLDHLIAALKKRGIYVALELHGSRRFRVNDGVATPGSLPAGGGPASVFDPKLNKLATDTAKALMTHVNSETKITYKDEPAIAWITLAGEVSLFDLNDNANLPSGYAETFRKVAAETTGDRKHMLQTVETTRLETRVDALRTLGVSAPIASVSHWRREREFNDAIAAEGFDLIDDRLYWSAPSLSNPNYRSMLWSRDGGLIADAAIKRKPEKPYVIGQWCDFNMNLWSSPYEAAEQLLMAEAAASHDWDALVRRGLYVYPEVWGSNSPGTGGVEDIFQVPEVANSEPHVFALWPHSASLFLRPSDTHVRTATTKAKRAAVPGWQPDRGRLVLDTPFTQGLAGWPGGKSVTTSDLSVELESSYGVVVASSAGPEPIGKTNRLLVTAISRVAPTGFLYVDPWKRETADPGRPPLLAEPVIAKVVWKRKGTVRAFALDNNGARVTPVKVVKEFDGWRLVIDGTVPSLHWEMVLDAG